MRGELEIADLNSRYLSDGQLHVEQMGRGHAWLDTSTIESLPGASEFFAVLKLDGAEEIALRSGFVTLDQMEPWLAKFVDNAYAYAKYVREWRRQR
jgi:glucose-1-phosphate thymidylyltransferase